MKATMMTSARKRVRTSLNCQRLQTNLWHSSVGPAQTVILLMLKTKCLLISVSAATGRSLDMILLFCPTVAMSTATKRKIRTVYMIPVKCSVILERVHLVILTYRLSATVERKLKEFHATCQSEQNSHANNYAWNPFLAGSMSVFKFAMMALVNLAKKFSLLLVSVARIQFRRFVALNNTHAKKFVTKL